MSSTVLERFLCTAVFALVSTAAYGADGQLLSCAAAQNDRVALEPAPAGVRRVGPHVLEIAMSAGSRKFVDRPPHDEGDMGGTHWRYCGFDARAKAHLVGMTEEGRYSGTLLMDATGQSIPAGHTVLFSPARKTFLAIEQEDGKDGEDWTVRNAAGKVLWQGYAGTIATVDGIEAVQASFEQPRWTGRGELTARMVCASSKPGGTVTLVPDKGSDWRWQGIERCR